MVCGTDAKEHGKGLPMFVLRPQTNFTPGNIASYDPARRCLVDTGIPAGSGGESLPTGTAGDLAGFDDDGNLADSGISSVNPLFTGTLTVGGPSSLDGGLILTDG